MSRRRVSASTGRDQPTPSMTASQARVAGDPKRDLEPDSDSGWQNGAELAEQRELCRIPHGRPVRKRADRDVQSDRGADQRQRLVGCMRREPSLHPAELRRRHSGRSAQLAQRHSRSKAGFSDLFADRNETAASQPLAPRRPSLLTWHEQTMPSAPYPRLTLGPISASQERSKQFSGVDRANRAGSTCLRV